MHEPAEERERSDLVRIFDTTLRDGEQSPGASLRSDQKLLIARELAALGVDIIEAGFPAASPDDAAAVERIAREVGVAGGPTIAGLARAKRGDIETAFKSVQQARSPRIHTFLATSDLHLEYKLKMSRREVIDQVGEMVRFASSLCDDVEFSPEDAGRSDIDFLVEVLGVAIEAGARTLNIPDTVGYLLPHEVQHLFERLIAETPGADRVVWSAHCHDDLGLATANSLAALSAGARQVEVTVNGIGERAGNTSLEEVVMALHTRRHATGLETSVDTTRITRASDLVRRLTGMVVAPNKAIVGDNAFAHEAGIHQDGMLKDPRTYEIMTPATVGRRVSRLVLGKHSGRHAFTARLEALGISLPDEARDDLFRRFKELADRRKEVTDADLVALARDEVEESEGAYHLESLQISSSHPGTPTATVTLRTESGELRVAPAVGSGSVDAIFRAIQAIVEVPSTLEDFTIHNVAEGLDALGEDTVRLSPDSGARSVHIGYGADTDILVASARAYVAAVNRLLAHRGRRRPPMRLFAADEPVDPSYTLGIP